MVISVVKRRILAAAAALALLTGLTALSQASAHRNPPFCGSAVCAPLSLIVREERLPEGKENDLPPLEDGDILLTTCAHSFGWRHGHAALVVDAHRGITAEAISIAVPSALQPVERWRSYPTFTVVRVRDADPVTRRAAAEYAANHLVDLPYRLTSGVWGEKAPAEPVGGQCAYLVWYAYRQFGYDLDGDGGKLVTVADLLGSPELEVVAQVGTLP